MPTVSILSPKEDVPSHRRPGSNGDGGTPDWFFWTLALLLLTIGVLVFMFGDRI